MADPFYLERLCKAFVRLVPQFYIAEYGPEHHSIRAGDTLVIYFSHRPLTPQLRLFNATCTSKMLAFAQSPLLENPSFVESVQEALAIEWLKQCKPNVNWGKAIGYLRDLTHRTYENNAVAVNLVVSQGTGTVDITTDKFQKVLDQLGSSPFTYLRVDQQLQYMKYEEITWSQVTDPTSYSFHPSFLHPFHCITQPTDEATLHVTSRGDIVIMALGGLLASRRKGQWKIYDVQTFKNSITDCLGSYYVGANLFEILFDLSFRRHGALLIYDKDFKVVEHIINKDCSMARGKGIFAELSSSVQWMGIGKSVGSLKTKRLLAEIASVDGAVVFNDDRIVAFGAMILPHDEAKGMAGTRSTAALSALHYGGRPMKISSDGEISVLFKSRGPNEGEECIAHMEFL